jgi:Ca2+-binding RTX toxin-like protein
MAVINGTVGNDSITGTSGDDTINGLAGNDLLVGGFGVDRLFGGSGNDTLWANGPGFNSFLGTGGGVLDGGDGIDWAVVNGQFPTVAIIDEDNPAANFSYITGNGVGIIHTLINIELVQLRDQFDQITDEFEISLGTAGNDSLSASFAFNVRIWGGAGNDTLVGNIGDDILDGGAGADTFSGGSGDDLFVFDTLTDFGGSPEIITDFAIGDRIVIAGGDRIYIGDGAFSGTAGEYRIFIGGGQTQIQFDTDGNGAADGFITLTNGQFSLSETFDGSNSLEITVIAPSTSGDDSIQGGLGDDTIDGLGGNDTISGSFGNDSLLGSDGNDSLFGDTGNDIVNGGAGNDHIEGEEGDDTVSGGAGDDIFQFDTVDELGTTGDVITDLELGDVIDFSQIRLPGSILPTYIGTNAFSGAVGEYRYQTGGGQTQIQFDVDGNGVADRFVIITNGEINLYQSGFHMLKAASTTPSVGVDFINGTSGADTIDGLTGSDTINGLQGDDLLIGSAGFDQLNGGAGADTLIGGQDNDTLDGGDGIDTVSYAMNLFDVDINLQSGTTSEGTSDIARVDLDTLLNVENAIGSGFDDSIDGSSGNNVLNGLGGADAINGRLGSDTLIGGVGADTLNGGAGMDIASYSGSGSAVTVNLQTGFVSGGDAAGDTFTGIEGLQGSAFADSLTGDAGANTLSGGAGNDRLFAGFGDDRGVGGSGNDLIKGGPGKDTLLGGADNDTLGGSNRSDLLRGEDGNDLMLGSNGNDRLLGGNGDDTMLGGNGRDTLQGDAGDDRLRGQNGTDVLNGGAGGDYLDGGDGTDTASYADASSRVQVRLWAGDGTKGEAIGDQLIGIENLEGSAFNDILSGDAANNRLDGNAGNDILQGLDGADILVGDGGNDTLTGGTGNDQFWFSKGGGSDTITDFTPGAGDDLVRLFGFGNPFNTFSEVIGASSQVGSDVVIDFGGGDTITLENTTLASLTAADFMFI